METGEEEEEDDCDDEHEDKERTELNLLSEFETETTVEDSRAVC